MSTLTQPQVLRIGHSPDPDDAFMWYPLADLDGSGPKVDTAGYRFEHVLEDIESLNHRSERGELEITAISMHQYPYVAERYALTNCGASMGEGYGPMVIAPRALTLAELLNASAPPRLAIPGVHTSAWLALQLLLKEHRGDAEVDQMVETHVVPFDQINQRVQTGEFDAGLIIHEGQLTYADEGLHCVADLGAWWKRTRDLPLPLGGNAIRRDLGERMPVICRVLYDSIRYALDHREEATQYALSFGRGLGLSEADRFIHMYVNPRTLDYAQEGKEAVRQFLREGVETELIPSFQGPDFVEPEHLP